MEHALARDFLVLSLNPENGKIATSSIELRYSFTGALLMEYMNSGELTIRDKRLIPSFRMNGDPVHDLVAERISSSSRNKRVSYWIGRLTSKSRFMINNIILSLENDRIIRIEHRKFLGIFPYRRFWLNNPGLRSSIVERLRSILLHGRQPSKEDLMLLALVESSKAYKRLSPLGGETRTMKRRNKEILKGDIIGAEICQAIREIQAAVASSVMAATMVSHGSH